ncbi:hypothetical protein [Spongiimicrobium salis]|uniref:hypothetical protein n=1 Tax=Spongiimicrobium salis TaxID=1667022 RepID=UPI00374CCC91
MKSKQIYMGLLIGNLVVTAWLCYHIILEQKEPLDFSKDILKVRGLVVTDTLGVERVIIGASLPDPTFNGYRNFRGSDEGIAGVMLYDSEGQERGGYVTDDGYGNVYLTLDSKTQQNALFIADPLGGGAMQVWGKNGNKISFSAGDDGLYMDLLENNNPLKLNTDED